MQEVPERRDRFLSMMTRSRAKRAPGSTRTISAISRPANIAVTIVGPVESARMATPMSASGVVTRSSKRPGQLMSYALMNGSSRLLSSSLPYIRISAGKVVPLRRTRNCRTAVCVNSVNGCCSPRMVITKPTQQLKPARIADEGTSSGRASSNAGARNENPIESPATRPDQKSAPEARLSSASPSSRATRWITSDFGEP